MLHVVDTRNISAGWRRLSDSPGHSKSCMVFAPVGGKLFILVRNAPLLRHSIPKHVK